MRTCVSPYQLSTELSIEEEEIEDVEEENGSEKSQEGGLSQAAGEYFYLVLIFL